MGEARTNLVRKNVSAPAAVWAEIAEYRYAERISTESEAVRRLIQDALERWRTRRDRRKPER